MLCPNHASNADQNWIVLSQPSSQKIGLGFTEFVLRKRGLSMINDTCIYIKKKR